LAELAVERQVFPDGHGTLRRILQGLGVEGRFHFAVTDQFAVLHQLEVRRLAAIEGGLVVRLEHDAVRIADQITQHLDVRRLVRSRRVFDDPWDRRIVGYFHQVADLIDHSARRWGVRQPRYPADLVQLETDQCLPLVAPPPDRVAGLLDLDVPHPCRSSFGSRDGRSGDPRRRSGSRKEGRSQVQTETLPLQQGLVER
jgi:hypothetical protein